MEIANNIISVLEFIFQKLGIAFDWTVDTVTPYLEEALVRFVSWKCSEYQFLDYFWHNFAGCRYYRMYSGSHCHLQIKLG